MYHITMHNRCQFHVHKFLSTKNYKQMFGYKKILHNIKPNTPGMPNIPAVNMVMRLTPIAIPILLHKKTNAVPPIAERQKRNNKRNGFANAATTSIPKQVNIIMESRAVLSIRSPP